MKGFLGVIVFVALVAFGFGLSQSGAALLAVSPKPSQEVVDQIAKKKADEEVESKKAQREWLAGVVQVLKYGLAGTFVSGFSIAGTFVAVRIIRRNDRPLDENGHAPLVPAKADLANPNLTGALTGAPVDPQMALQLARLRAQVDTARMMFAGGVNGRMAGNSQRDVLPKWDGEIETPEMGSLTPGVDHPNYWLTDEKAQEPALAAAGPMKFAQGKEALQW